MIITTIARVVCLRGFPLRVSVWDRTESKKCSPPPPPSPRRPPPARSAHPPALLAPWTGVRGWGGVQVHICRGWGHGASPHSPGVSMGCKPTTRQD